MENRTPESHQSGRKKRTIPHTPSVLEQIEDIATKAARDDLKLTPPGTREMFRNVTNYDSESGSDDEETKKLKGLIARRKPRPMLFQEILTQSTSVEASKAKVGKPSSRKKAGGKANQTQDDDKGRKRSPDDGSSKEQPNMTVSKASKKLKTTVAENKGEQKGMSKPACNGNPDGDGKRKGEQHNQICTEIMLVIFIMF